MVQQLEGLAKTVGLNLAGPRCEDEVEGSVLVYNLAVAKFQQRHMLQVGCQDYNCSAIGLGPKHGPQTLGDPHNSTRF